MRGWGAAARARTPAGGWGGAWGCILQGRVGQGQEHGSKGRIGGGGWGAWAREPRRALAMGPARVWGCVGIERLSGRGWQGVAHRWGEGAGSQA